MLRVPHGASRIDAHYPFSFIPVPLQLRRVASPSAQEGGMQFPLAFVNSALIFIGGATTEKNKTLFSPGRGDESEHIISAGLTVLIR